MKISATIVAWNEENKIARAIRSLECCDEVLVIDSNSSDGTSAIASSLGARVVSHEWEGYARQKNLAASQAQHDWILSIDADEELSAPLGREIESTKLAEPAFDGYRIPRLARYCGRWIRHSGWHPDRKVRLYHRERAHWTGAYVHESVAVNGPVGDLQNNLLHYTCDSLSEHLQTLDRYTTLAAREIAARQAAIGSSRLLLDPAWTWFKTYLLQRGFLDGAEGLSIAWMGALYTHLKYAKARAQLNERTSP